MTIKETTKYVTGAIQGTRLISQHASLTSAKKNLSKARKKDPRAEVFTVAQWNEGLAKRLAGKKVEKPVVEVPKTKAPETGEALFDASEYFRAESCKLALAELLADGQEHEVLELQGVCDLHGLKTYQVINFTAMRLRRAGFTVKRSAGVVQVRA